MKINTETSPLYSAPRTQPSSTPDTGPSSFSSALAASGQTPSARSADSTSMTRQEMTDWMNEQIRTGKMSLDESVGNNRGRTTNNILVFKIAVFPLFFHTAN